MFYGCSFLDSHVQLLLHFTFLGFEKFLVLKVLDSFYFISTALKCFYVSDIYWADATNGFHLQRIDYILISQFVSTKAWYFDSLLTFNNNSFGLRSSSSLFLKLNELLLYLLVDIFSKINQTSIYHTLPNQIFHTTLLLVHGTSWRRRLLLGSHILSFFLIHLV